MDSPVCRTCESTQGLTSIFDEENKPLVGMLLRVVNIKVREDDSLPSHICYSCANRLQMAYEFVVMCKKTELNLRRRIFYFTTNYEEILQSPINFDNDEESSIDEPIDRSDYIDSTAATVSPLNPNRTLKLVEEVAKGQQVNTNFEKAALPMANETPTKCPNSSDDENVTIKVEPIEEIIVQSVLDPPKPTVITIEDDTEIVYPIGQLADDADSYFNIDDIIEVDEDYIEENYVNLVKSIEDLPGPPEMVQPVAAKSRKKPKLKKPRIKLQKSYVCSRCQASFTKWNDFQLHRKTHKKNRPKCPYCSKEFKDVTHLRTHTNIHEGIKFDCHICGKQCSTPANLRRHIEQVHDKIKPYACDICDRTFHRSSTLEDHRYLHSGRRDFVCSTCNKSFKTPLTLRVHQSIHDPDPNKRKYVYEQKRKYDRPFICEVCGKYCKTQANYQQHMRTHSDDFAFECSICQAKLKTKVGLSSHMLRHKNEKPYPCEICGKRFRQPVHLRTHLKSIHQPKSQRKYPCRFCDSRYVTENSLKIHERIHTNERPHECADCEMRFIDKSCLRRHRLRIHGIEDPRRIQRIFAENENSNTIPEVPENDTEKLEAILECTKNQDVIESFNEIIKYEL